MKKPNNNELYEKIKNVLIKKAEGFFYNEEILEYQTEDNQKIKKEKNTCETTEIVNKQNEEEQTKRTKNQNLTLLKKKITTHYVPPDLLAIKMLFEIYGQKVESVNELEKLEFNQLLELKNNLLKQLKDD